MQIIENQSYALEDVFDGDLEDILEDIAASTGVALEGVESVIVEDLSTDTKEVGFELKLGDRIVWLVEEDLTRELALYDALSDPLSFLRSVSDFEIQAMLDLGLFKDLMIKDVILNDPNLSEEEALSKVEDSLDRLDSMGPVTYLREVLNYSGDAFYLAIINNGLINLNDLAQLLIDEYGHHSILDIDREERYLSLSDDYVCFLVY